MVMLNCAMHNVLRPSLLGDFRTSNGELIWEKRENPVAEAKAARESPSPYSALSVDVWFRLIRPRDTQSGSPLSILSLHVNSDSKEASFRLAKSHSITVSAVRCILERSIGQTQHVRYYCPSNIKGPIILAGSPNDGTSSASEIHSPLSWTL
jgi:hypothetical protein